MPRKASLFFVALYELFSRCGGEMSRLISYYWMAEPELKIKGFEVGSAPRCKASFEMDYYTNVKLSSKRVISFPQETPPSPGFFMKMNMRSAAALIAELMNSFRDFVLGILYS